MKKSQLMIFINKGTDVLNIAQNPHIKADQNYNIP